MTTDFRAMCAELLAWAEHTSSHYYKQPDVLDRARALLAQPVAGGPTDEELLRLAREWNSGFESIELHFAADFARAVLAKWGHQ